MCKFNFYHFNAYNIPIKRQKKLQKKLLKIQNQLKNRCITLDICNVYDSSYYILHSSLCQSRKPIQQVKLQGNDDKITKKYIFPFIFLRSVPLKKKPPVCIIFRIADLAITLSLSLCCEVFNILTSFQRPTPPRHIMNLLFNLL